MTTPETTPASRGPRAAAATAWTTAVWVTLWGDLSVANVLGGLAVSAVTLLLVGPRRKPLAVTARPLATIRFVAAFLAALVKSSVQVAWEVVTPGDQRDAGVVAIPLQSRSPAIVTVVANTVSLTPGTLTVEATVDPPMLYVHMLHVRDVVAARQDVRRFERLALEAFGHDDREGN